MKLLRVTAVALIAVFAAAPSLAQGNQMPMGQGTMGQAMGPGMMPGGMGMMNCPMMGMMAEHKEGYIAFLKTELAITDAQANVWDPFANAIRELAGKMQAMPMGSMMGGGMMGGGQERTPLPDALKQSVETMQAHLDGLKAVRDAAGPLYQALSQEQRAKADQLLGCPMHMM